MGVNSKPGYLPKGEYWSVYVLKDPRDGAVRYVGLSYRPEYRLKEHLYTAKHGRYHVHRWIGCLLKEGVSPVMEIVEDKIEDGKHGEVERSWIQHFKSEGCKLTNLTDGGEGVKGLARTPEMIDRMRKSLTGRHLSPEHRAKLSRIRKGRKVTEETRRRMSIGLSGLKRKPETLAKMSAANLGKKLSPECRAKISAALMGRFVSAETRLKKSLSTKGRKGKPWSEESKVKVSKSLTGIKRTEETKVKMRQSQIVRRDRERFLNSVYVGGGLYV